MEAFWSSYKEMAVTTRGTRVTSKKNYLGHCIVIFRSDNRSAVLLYSERIFSE